MKIEIWCPKCRWHPKPDSKWFCSKCIRGIWNTFDTAGKCPVCGYQWEDTICLACHKWSKHMDWYHFPDDIFIAILESAETGIEVESGI